jgi:hypothetical protein
MGTGDFTWEAWIYFGSGSSFRQIFSTRPSNGTSSAEGSLAVNTSNGLTWYTSGFIINYTTSIGVNQWVHVAISRSGTTLRVFANGVQVGSATNSENLTGNGFTIGANGNGSEAFNGYISNVRVVKGTAVYTAAFTPPTSPVTAITNTSLLTNFTNAGILDNTGFNALETVGNAQIDTSVKKYGTGSMEFDGNGDYLLPGGNADNFVFGTGDFTIEGWVYFNNLTTDHTVYDSRPASTNGAYILIDMPAATDKLRFYTQSASRIESDSTLSASAWYHFALVRASGSTKMYINGTAQATTYSDTNSYLNPSGRPVIAASGFNLLGGLNGFIDDLRITKGIARYTSNFTPPTLAFRDQGI